jgi:hypothetical protein
MSRPYQIMLSILIIYVIMTILAELAHAYRSKSVRALWSIYTFGFTLAVLTILLRLTVIHITSEMPFYLIMFYIVMVDYFALYLLSVYVWFRGGYLLALLIGRGHSYKTNWPMQKRLNMYRHFVCGFGVLIIIRAIPYIVFWIMDILGY